MNEAEFLSKLREAFAVEADEHFRTISKCLSDLEHASNGDRHGVIELIFREAHSLKGAARAINRTDIEALCQSLESLFSVWKKDPGVASQGQFDLSAEALEILAEMLNSDAELSLNSEPLESVVERLRIESSQTLHGSAAMHPEQERAIPVPGVADPAEYRSGRPGAETDHAAAELAAGGSITRERAAPAAPASTVQATTVIPAAVQATTAIPAAARASTERAPAAAQASAELAPAAAQASPVLTAAGAVNRNVKDTIRVPIGELESLYRQTEELSGISFMLGRHAADLRRVMDQCREWIREYHKQRQSGFETSQLRGGRQRSGESDANQLEQLQNFMKWTARQIEGIESAVGKNLEDGQGTMYILESMSEAMIDNAKQLLLMPFSLVTDPLPGIVRKLARDLNKEVRFRIEGEGIRIDKRILEALKDPLLHLIRNSLDHGIEDAATRAGRQKPVTGNITLHIRTARDSRIEMLLEDDGRGIDIERVKGKAVAEGLLTGEKAAKLTDADALDLVFLSGVTTSPIITDVSGRGVGLNVVRENILALGGEIEIETETGIRTMFRISLPLSLSNTRGVLVRSQEKHFVVPLQFVERGISAHRENFSLLDGKTVMEYEGRTVTVRRLEEILSGYSPNKKEERPHATVLMLRVTSHLLAIEVDEILWEQDVVIKPLPAPVSRIRTIAGATLLGTGELVLVLQVPDLLEASRGVPAHVKTEQMQAGEKRRNRLLVVDDSITSRVLLHDILVATGYEVKTAVDGIDALTHLREEQFDLIVSDVEMPRMNGFELTETLRNDEKMHDVPVVLVTGLESQEDRERGFDVGANAYINKSSFDQSNLIEVIERLI
jgi:two-component system chemotaxis sensor kinase CheA